MLKNTNNINYIHSTGSLGSQVSGAHIQVEMDLISHNSTRDIGKLLIVFFIVQKMKSGRNVTYEKLCPPPPY